jgi:hypothetical protein
MGEATRTSVTSFVVKQAKRELDQNLTKNPTRLQDDAEPLYKPTARSFHFLDLTQPRTSYVTDGSSSLSFPLLGISYTIVQENGGVEKKSRNSRRSLDILISFLL